MLRASPAGLGEAAAAGRFAHGFAKTVTGRSTSPGLVRSVCRASQPLPSRRSSSPLSSASRRGPFLQQHALERGQIIFIPGSPLISVNSDGAKSQGREAGVCRSSRDGQELFGTEETVVLWCQDNDSSQFGCQKNNPIYVTPSEAFQCMNIQLLLHTGSSFTCRI